MPTFYCTRCNSRHQERWHWCDLCRKCHLANPVNCYRDSRSRPANNAYASRGREPTTPRARPQSLAVQTPGKRRFDSYSSDKSAGAQYPPNQTPVQGKIDRHFDSYPTYPSDKSAGIQHFSAQSPVQGSSNRQFGSYASDNSTSPQSLSVQPSAQGINRHTDSYSSDKQISRNSVVAWTGAHCHAFNHIKWFTVLRRFVEPVDITLAGGETLQATHAGDVQFYAAATDGEPCSVSISNVHYTSRAPHNQVSMAHLGKGSHVVDVENKRFTSVDGAELFKFSQAFLGAQNYYLLEVVDKPAVTVGAKS